MNVSIIRITGFTISLMAMLVFANVAAALPPGFEIPDDIDLEPPTIEFNETEDGKKVKNYADDQVDYVPPATKKINISDLISYLTILVLAIFLGFEIITKVPATLHTPLMSGSNAISGITLIGAILAGTSYLSAALAFLAVLFATVNVVGGFFVTHRMLGMFRKKG